MNTKRNTILTAIGAVVAVLILAGVLIVRALIGPVTVDGPVQVEIVPGMTAADVASLLHDAGIIKSPRYFRWVAARTGYATAFKAGTHELDGVLSPGEVAALLTDIPPAPPDVTVTVYEGLTIAETASLLDGIAAIDSTSFVQCASDPTIAYELGIDKPALEGYLYPDTYFIRHDTTAREMVERMVRTFQVVFDDSLYNRASALGMSMHEVVTLASIIELEAGRDSERPMVSQVFHRRMELGRPLEANPTIQYALGEKRRVLTEDLSVDSPYNTYTHRGLPPGPIASPGAASIHAALWPADTTYLYFMADGVGGHVFSRSLAEHNRAVSQYRKLRQEQRRR